MKYRAKILYISKRSKPTHGAEIEETQPVSQATTNHPHLTYWPKIVLHSISLTPLPESYVLIPWPLFKHSHFSSLTTTDKLDTVLKKS